MTRKIEVGKRMLVSELEIKLFCNKNYEGSGEVGVVLKVYPDRAKIRLQNELEIDGYTYKDILINTNVHKLSEEDIKYSFAMQDDFFKRNKKLN